MHDLCVFCLKIQGTHFQISSLQHFLLNNNAIATLYNPQDINNMGLTNISSSILLISYTLIHKHSYVQEGSALLNEALILHYGRSGSLGGVSARV